MLEGCFREDFSMKDDHDKLFVVYSIPEHCGHEVINRIFLDLEQARKYVYPINKKYSEDFSYWDGSPTALDIKTKILKNGIIEDWDNCDVCGYHCECLGNSPTKTREAYEAYWTPERSDHVHEHFYKRVFVSTCNFCIDPKENYNTISCKT